MPHRVTKIIQGKRGKGGGFVRATLKNMESSNSFEKTFTSDEMGEYELSGKVVIMHLFVLQLNTPIWNDNMFNTVGLMATNSCSWMSHRLKYCHVTNIVTERFHRFLEQELRVNEDDVLVKKFLVEGNEVASDKMSPFSLTQYDSHRPLSYDLKTG